MTQGPTGTRGDPRGPTGTHGDSLTGSYTDSHGLTGLHTDSHGPTHTDSGVPVRARQEPLGTGSPRLCRGGESRAARPPLRWMRRSLAARPCPSGRPRSSPAPLPAAPMNPLRKSVYALPALPLPPGRFAARRLGICYPAREDGSPSRSNCI